MKIVIKNASATVAVVNWEGKKFDVTKQQAVFESDDGETRCPISLTLKDGQAPYSVGEYRLGDGSFFVDGKYQSLQFNRVVELVPLKAALSKVG
jgi:hypothetical protein